MNFKVFLVFLVLIVACVACVSSAPADNKAEEEHDGVRETLRHTFLSVQSAVGKLADQARHGREHKHPEAECK